MHIFMQDSLSILSSSSFADLKKTKSLLLNVSKKASAATHFILRTRGSPPASIPFRIIELVKEMLYICISLKHYNK